MASYIRECHERRLHLALWKKGQVRPEGEKGLVRVPYHCRSWRHPGRCAIERSQEDAARIKAALGGHRAEDTLLLVLTFSRKGATAPEDEFEAFKVMRDRWRSFAKALRREWGDMAYVSTVEKHDDGWPHLNAILVSPGLALELRVRAKKVVRELKRHAVLCGFGWRLTCEVARDAGQVAGYIVKLADGIGRAPEAAGATVGEVVKRTQLPTNAPKGFRRLRSSVRFLPKKPETEWTGELQQFPHPADMTAEQREAWERDVEWRAWHRAHQAALEAAPEDVKRERAKGRTWDRSNAAPVQQVLLDVSGLEGFEPLDDSAWPWTEPTRPSSAERARPEQEELF